MTRILILLGLVLLLPLPATAKKPRSKAGKAKWHAVQAPSAQRPQALGGYANGCLAGGVEVGPEGDGFQMIRLWRRRNFGHPGLADFLKKYGRKVLDAGLPGVLVGDLSQPRGGKMSSGHSSHRVGLDADIWFSRPDDGKRGKDDHFRSLVDTANEKIDREVFSEEHVKLLKMAAEEPEVARIFVNWVIKHELCATVEGDRSWLAKVRPWYGHDRHFHVRLACPEDSPQCVDQAPVGPGDGCGEETWFSRAEIAQRREEAKKGVAKKAPSAKKKARTPFPADCQTVLAASPKQPTGSDTTQVTRTKAKK